MDVLIKGMEIPTKVNHPLFIRISSDGHIAKGDFLKGGFIETEAKAIELPPHGRLIDADKLASNYINCLSVCYPLMNIEKARELANAVKEAVKIAPTVLEAST